MRQRPIAILVSSLMASVTMSFGSPADASPPAAAAVSEAPTGVGDGSDDASSSTPPSTFNVFWPEERSLSDCLGALQRPNCGSEARGGWRQATVFGLILAALGFIGWRITRLARRGRVEPATATAPGGDGDDHAP